MTGTYCPVGLPVSIGGVWYAPTRVMSLTQPPYTTVGTTSLTGVPISPADILPVSIGTPALTALLADGGATQCG
jgi:hypothetical protein